MKVTYLLALISFSGLHFTPEVKTGATAQRVGGVAVFIYSEPSEPYDIIESSRLTVVMDCDNRISKPISKAVKAKADGVIIHFEQNRYDLIKFK
jgi:hypothetical protein